MQPTCHGDGAADDPPLSSTASQEAWDLEIIGSVFLGLFGFRMWLGHRCRRDANAGATRCSTEGALRLYIRPLRRRIARTCLNSGEQNQNLTSPPIPSSITAPKKLFA